MNVKVCGVLLVVSLWSCSVRAATVHLYVSPTGSDSNDGRHASHPVKSLSHVKDLLQADGIAGNNVFVELMPGYHDLTSTLHFDHDISGNVVFRAYQGQEVHVTGGKRIPSNLFHHVTDQHMLQRLPQESRDKVLELDLGAAGVTNLGTLTQFGFGKMSWTAPLEIFINGKPLILAEWPNRDFTNIQSVPDGEHGRRFTYDSGGRDTKWAQETEPWVYGWWYWSWADAALKVSSINAQSHTITLAQDSQYGLRVGHWNTAGDQVGYGQQGGYFRVINMLCELDLPGEYYIDRTNKKLYVWPNTPQQTLMSSDVVYASLVDKCITIESMADNLDFQDFSLEACRQYGVEMRNSRDITFKNMEIKNTGSFAIHCSGDCRRVSVLASEIHDVGGGIYISGGDSTALNKSEILIQDNEIRDHSRCGAQNGDAIHIGGVGTTVTHNHLHHGSYTGIRWSGNDHIMEYNNVHHMCWNSSDCGAIHSGRDWTWRGNVIRHNHIHHTLRFHPGADVRGIMLDDEYSSVLIEHNVFYENEVHANIGGGRDNIIRYNVMYNARSRSIQVDGRGLGSGGHSDYLRNKLQNSPYQTPLWQSRYPELYNILSKHPEAPEGNQIYQNVFYNPPGIERIHYGGNNLQRSDYFDVHDNVRMYKKTDFWAPDEADFRFRCEAAQWASHNHVAEPVTLSEVGPQVPTGPNYLRAHRPATTSHTSSSPSACDTSTVAPDPTPPRGSYMADGSSPNTLYPDIPTDGCYFVIDHCPNHPTAEGTHKDDIGTQSGTEEGCLSRAGPQWVWCGSPDNGQVVAVYGPTGAMTMGGKGCYFAEYGCRSEHVGFHEDVWAEEHVGAATNEAACLGRAAPQWRYCGSHEDRPITSIYRPTGAFRTAGGGCWIKIPSCPDHPNDEGFFYDAWGATNVASDTDQVECFDRAEYYWIRCGSHADAPVTAFYRPNAASHTVP